ncbi:CrcB family protein [Nocardioides sp. BP30]|uniref:fluoride efflux transporter FluC n=1 Tax=Nocardioides sp. BP30 TaxID=3036374 RepID=UPI00246900BE|nr:CrcB family protein [Nocardioides sp. BP30]WGL52154.1 CrcB family protein [Nocardioides sp. BP30]
MTPPERVEDPDRVDPAVDCDVELAERPAPHPGQLLREHVPLLPAIAVGGAIGSLARYGVAEAVPHTAREFAWATLATNLTGALLLGVLMALMLTVWSHTRYVRPFLGVGVLGGYTTFSTYELDTRGLLAAGHPAEALGYVGATVALGLVAVLAGLAGGRLLIGRRAGGRGPETAP